MATPSQPLYTFAAKSNVQIRDDILRTIKSGLIAQGIPTPNIGPNSDYYLIATALGNELAVPQANAVILADQLMPDTAAGSFLDRWLALVGLARNGATSSFGNITITTSANSLVPTNAQLVDNAGLRYQVTVGGTYANQAQIPVQSIDTGAATDHANGDTLTWVTAPPFAQQNVTVGLPGGTDGLTGGADSEVGVDEPPRARLFALLQVPPKGGNSSDLILWAQQSSTSVQAAFAYPALLGASTSFFAVTGHPQTSPPLTSTSKNRDLPGALLTGTILPYVLGLMPEHSLCVGTSVANQPADVAIQLSLPSSPTASPAGPGGGWLDGTPWPTSTTPGVPGTKPCTVIAFATSTQFTVNAPTPPTKFVSHIAWISPLTWQLYTATVVDVSGSTGNYTITIDTPMPGIAVHNIIFPQSANQATYFATLLSSFAAMGPGEWLPPGSAGLKRSFRHPLPALTWPYALGPTQLSALIRSGPEVQNAQFLFTGDITLGSPSTFNVPVIGGQPILVDGSGNLTTTPPSVFVPRNIGFYAS
jgi:hypothetical protein